MDPTCKAAMILGFDIDAPAVAEHDDWHSHEHLLERLAIPGFLRATRWVALAGEPRYFVMYEVADLAVLDSPAYLERLNHPSPWTSKMMPSYRGMKRGLCSITARFGSGLGGFALLVRLGAAASQRDRLRTWLCAGVLPALPARRGLVSTCLFESGLEAASTAEQRIRGHDAGVDTAVLVTGYTRADVAALADGDLAAAALERQGATGVAAAVYQLVHCLTQPEVARAGPA